MNGGNMATVCHRPRMVTRAGAVLAFAILGARTAPAAPQEMPPARPDEVGMSVARLQRLSAVMQEYVEAGRIAGTVTLVARRGKVAHLEAHGWSDAAARTSMRPDAIFRIASQSKAVTTVAAMMLVEEGRIGLNDPVSRFIPEFAEATVHDSARDSLLPAVRPVTVRHLLTHTSGLSYGDHLADRFRSAGVYGYYFADKPVPIGTSAAILGRLPLAAQPGDRWIYGFSTDVLGRVVEVASGLSLEAFLQTRILTPLDMRDTHFYLPPEKRARLTAVHAATDRGIVLAPTDGSMGQGAYVDGPRLSFSGGAGLLSTARDYSRFLQMLLNGGELHGVRLLSPKTVQLMTVDHLGDRYGPDGFGFGFWVIEDLGQSGDYGSVGAYGWGGAYFSTYWVDPAEELVAVFLSQLIPSRGLDLREKFRTLVYQAIVESTVAR